MTDTQTKPPAAAKTVLIFHTGKGHGPMHTSNGVLAPGQSLEVPVAIAEKLTAAYAHVKYAKEIIPGGGADPRVAAENEMLKKELARLQGLVDGHPADVSKAAEDAAAKAAARIAELEEQVAELSKKQGKQKVAA